nr:hypothetical protein [Pseudoxanthomonas sp.]
MTLYTELATVADELLAELGQSVTIRHRTAGAYDPATGSVTVTTSDEAGYGAVFDYDTKHIDGTMIVRGDKYVLLSPVGITAPDTDDRLIIGGVDYAVIGIKTEAPAGTAVLHTVQIRR